MTTPIANTAPTKREMVLIDIPASSKMMSGRGVCSVEAQLQIIEHHLRTPVRGGVMW